MHALQGWVQVDQYPWIYSAAEARWYWAWSPNNALWLTDISGDNQLLGEKGPRNWAPENPSSLTMVLEATDATYAEDINTIEVSFSAADLSSDRIEYTRTSSTSAEIRYTGIGGYSGTIYLVFTSPTEGTYREEYTGEYVGYILGNFTITAIQLKK